MNSNNTRNAFSRHLTSFAKNAGGVSLVTLAAGSMLFSSCNKKSKSEEDVASLKLVGYELDQLGLFKAVENDDLSSLEIFKAQKFDMLEPDLTGRTALHVAAESGSMSALSYLVKNGVIVDGADNNGITPLMEAARSSTTAGSDGNAEVIRYLIDKGADAQVKDKIGKFPLLHALDSGSPQAIELLASQSRQLLDTGLLYAADQNKHESIPVLTRYGASVYARNSGKTGLMIAAERGYTDAVLALVAEGSNLYAVSDDGKLARDFADGNDDVIAVLLAMENEAGDDALALEWSEEELEALVQKAMERTVEEGTGTIASSTNGGAKPLEGAPAGGSNGNIGSSNNDEVVQRISGKSLPLEFTDTAMMVEQVTMTGYAEKSLPVLVRAVDVGRVEVYDLRANEAADNTNPVVVEGSEIGLTGLTVKEIKKKVVNNKLTEGQDKELVTLMVEDRESGQSRELYAGYESQAADAVAVLKMNDSGEHLVVERDDEFYDLKGTVYRVEDVNEKEVIIENTATGKLTLLPLMGVKR